MSRSARLVLGVTVLTVALSTSAATAGEVFLWYGKGSFPAHERYDWCGEASPRTVWSYKVEILEVNWRLVPHGYPSSGRILITDGDNITIDARVEAVKRNMRPRWPKPHLAALGSVYIDNRKRRFSFLWAQDNMWFAIATDAVTDEVIETQWEAGEVLKQPGVNQTRQRDCELHSGPGSDFSYPTRERVCGVPDESRVFRDIPKP